MKSVPVGGGWFVEFVSDIDRDRFTLLEFESGAPKAFAIVCISLCGRSFPKRLAGLVEIDFEVVPCQQLRNMKWLRRTGRRLAVYRGPAQYEGSKSNDPGASNDRIYSPGGFHAHNIISSKFESYEGGLKFGLNFSSQR